MSEMNNKSIYFKHIDGLRAIAVLSVIFFHYGVSGFSGGYVGVDVFFVISGFLITRLLQEEIDTTGRLNFIHFYKRRIRRLLPAFCFVLYVTSILAVCFLPPDILVQYGNSLAASVISISNILFWHESGYFDTASHLKPLLHTWSLSVEEQFYLLWPLFILFFAQKGRTVVAVCAIFLVSLFLNYYFVHQEFNRFKSSLFFLTPFRIFEFAIGALCFYLREHGFQNKVILNLQLLIGLVLIGGSVFFLNEKAIFPYLNALPCCLGAALIILSKDGQLTDRLLGNKVMVGIGLLSYSLYLVHWPLYVFAKYIFVDVSSVRYLLLMLVSAFAVALISYFFIERPCRYVVTSRKGYIVIITVTFILFVLGIALKKSDGWGWRYANTPLTPFEIEAGKARRYIDLPNACNLLELNNANRCHMERPIQVLIIGNSHEPDGFNIFNYLYGKNKDVNIINFGTVNDCSFNVTKNAISSSKHALRCDERFALLNNTEFTGRLTHIVYSTHTGFESVAKNLWLVLNHLVSMNHNAKLIVLGSYLETSVDCSVIKNKEGSFEACKNKQYIKYFRPSERKTSPIPETKTLNYLYVNKFDLLCPTGEVESCLTFANSEPMFYDQHHLSYGFARYIGAEIAKKYDDKLIELGLPKSNVNN